MYSTTISYYVYYTTMEPVHSSNGDPALCVGLARSSTEYSPVARPWSVNHVDPWISELGFSECIAM